MDTSAKHVDKPDRQPDNSQSVEAKKLDDELKQIVVIAKQHPAGSRKRLKMTTLLLMKIEQSGKLFCPSKGDYPPEVYADALQALRIYIFKRLDSYDPSQAAMMTWINGKLRYTFIDAANKYNKARANRVSFSGSAGIEDGNGVDRNVEQAVSIKPEPLFSEQVYQVIKIDPDNIFRQKHIRGRPEVNFQVIALRLCEGYSRREIAEFFNIQEQTLYSFFSRSCRSFRSILQDYLTDGSTQKTP